MAALEKTLRGIVLAGAFALPFVVFYVASSLFFPYITGKNLAFRIIVEIMGGAWLALALVYSKYRPARSWLLGLFALFVLVIAVADAQGAYPLKSFWSNFERMDGWITLAHLLVYLVVLVSVVNSEGLWRRLWKTSIDASLALSVYGLLQLGGVLAFGQATGAGLLGRVDATLGNPIYLAVYMLFHIFMAALLWIEEKRERGRRMPLPLSVFYGSAIVLDTVALFFTGTRGAMIGFLGGVLTALLLYAVLSSGRSARMWAAGAFLALAIFGGALWAGRESAMVKEVGFLDRLASISLNDATVKARFINWSIAWQGVKERPILGWGQENYAIVFDKYYDPRMYAQEPWFDRVHNIIFDWWVAGGTLGLLSYLSIFGAALWAIWRSRGETMPFTPAEKSILTGLLIGYFCHNFFVFDNVTSYILFVMLLGYIVWRSHGASSPLLKHVPLREHTLPIVAALAALLVWGSAWYLNAGALAQNRTLLAALGQRPGGIMENLDLFKQSIAYGSYGTQEAREQLIQAASRLAGTSVDLQTKQSFFETAAKEMSLQAQVSPLDARFPLFLGILFDSYGDHANAAASLARAHELSPRKQAILYQMAMNAEVAGDASGALTLLKQAFELETSNNDARALYAAALIRAGNDTLADKVLQPVIASGGAANQQVLAAYMTKKRYDKVIAIWNPYVVANPADQQGYLTLAAAYYGAGDSARAIATLEALKTAVPSVAADVDVLIGQVRSGKAQLAQ